MFTYQMRQRKFVCEEGKRLIFPGDVEIIFRLSPLHLFGCGDPGGRTVIQRGKFQLKPDSHRGTAFLNSPSGLKPLRVHLKEEECRIEMNGNELHVNEYCQSSVNLEERIQDIFFGIPIFLNLDFFDPPIVEKVSGRVRNINFEWILDSIGIPLDFTTQEKQEKRVETAWKRWKGLSSPENERVFAALHYFHIACRLKIVGYSPWEFTGDIILNLCKVLEALFPPTNDGQTRESARKGLETLGYTKVEIERDFLPIMALRDNMDSGHIKLFKITKEKFQILYKYTDRANGIFKQMLQKLISKIQEGQYFPISYAVSQTKKKVADKVIEKIERNMEKS